MVIDDQYPVTAALWFDMADVTLQLQMIQSWIRKEPAMDITLIIYAAKLFLNIFHSFEAGIANAISSSKWRKIIILIRK